MLFKISSNNEESIQVEREAMKKVDPPCLLGMLLESHTQRFDKKAVFHFLTCTPWSRADSLQNKGDPWTLLCMSSWSTLISEGFPLPLALLPTGRQPHSSVLGVSSSSSYANQLAPKDGGRISQSLCAPWFWLPNRMACMLKPAKTIGFAELKYLYLPSINEFKRAKTC